MTKLENGKVIKENFFIRGKTLNGINQEDINFLAKDCGIKTVIDLRTDTERNQNPNPKIEGVNEIHIPIFTEAQTRISREKESLGIEALSKIPPDAGNL